MPLGRADLRGFDARSVMQSWNTRKGPAPADEWNRARESLRAAHQLDPAQPAYLEDLARLYELRALPLKAADPLAREYLREALELQRQALVRRPGSPYTWSNIALLKSRLGEIDAEFERALAHAAKFGPWEPGVQLALADVGFAQWGAISPPTRDVVRANASRTLRYQDKALFAIARRTGRLDILCTFSDIARSPEATACI